jgi:hypothetical protein
MEEVSNSSVCPFTIVESGNPTLPERNFFVNFNGKEIFSGKFFQGKEGAEYDVHYAWIRAIGGENVWAVYIISRPTYHSTFRLVRDGKEKVIEQKLTYSQTWEGGMVYPMLDVWFDGNWIVTLKSKSGDYEKTIYIDFDPDSQG